MPGFNVIRCWKFGSLDNPARLLNTIRQLNPDVVWYNLVFSTFATSDKPLAAFAGLSAPALTRAAGFYTHITLHHLLEHVDFSAAGVRRERLFRMGTYMATKALLQREFGFCAAPLLSPDAGNKVSLPRTCCWARTEYLHRLSLRRTLPSAEIPINAFWPFGHWGTYKRLETLMQAFPLVLKKAPRARLIVAGANHYTKPGYWESIRAVAASGFSH